jgi:hypothetical protein
MLDTGICWCFSKCSDQVKHRLLAWYYAFWRISSSLFCFTFACITLSWRNRLERCLRIIYTSKDMMLDTGIRWCFSKCSDQVKHRLLAWYYAFWRISSSRLFCFTFACITLSWRNRLEWCLRRIYTSRDIILDTGIRWCFSKCSAQAKHRLLAWY